MTGTDLPPSRAWVSSLDLLKCSRLRRAAVHPKKKRSPLPTSPERGNFCGDELPAVPHSEASNIIAEKLSDERPQCIMGCLLGPGTINLINYSLPLRRRKSPNRSVGHSFSHSLHLMWCQELILISKLRRQISDLLAERLR